MTRSESRALIAAQIRVPIPGHENTYSMKNAPPKSAGRSSPTSVITDAKALRSAWRPDHRRLNRRDPSLGPSG